MTCDAELLTTHTSNCLGQGSPKRKSKLLTHIKILKSYCKKKNQTNGFSGSLGPRPNKEPLMVCHAPMPIGPGVRPGMRGPPPSASSFLQLSNPHSLWFQNLSCCLTDLCLYSRCSFCLYFSCPFCPCFIELFVLNEVFPDTPLPC